MRISAQSVRELREMTEAGVMECKQALLESEGDLCRAEQLLKERGSAQVRKREDRAVNEGRLFLAFNGARAVLFELRCETDFVALNERFASLGQSCAEYLARLPGEPTIAPLRERIDETAAIIKENILPGTVHHFDAKMGQYLTGYLHGDAAKMGSLVLLDVAGARSNAVKKAAHELALHVVAAAPRFLSEESIPVEHRNAVIREFREESAGLGKPADLIERIVEGRWIKYVAATCLMRQKFFRDEQLTVSDWLATASEHANGTIAVSGIAYARTGE